MHLNTEIYALRLNDLEATIIFDWHDHMWQWRRQKQTDRNSFIQCHWRVKQERGNNTEAEEKEDKYSRSLCSGVKEGHGTLSQRHSRSSIYNEVRHVTNIPNSYQLRRGKGQNVDRIMKPILLYNAEMQSWYIFCINWSKVSSFLIIHFY